MAKLPLIDTENGHHLDYNITEKKGKKKIRGMDSYNTRKALPGKVRKRGSLTRGGKGREKRLGSVIAPVEPSGPGISTGRKKEN